MGFYVQSATASPPALAREFDPVPVDNSRETAKNEVPEFFTVNSGRRFYSPELGRWLNRDPIGEVGGENVYGFVANQPSGGIDLLGYLFGLFGGCKSTYAFKDLEDEYVPFVFELEIKGEKQQVILDRFGITKTDTVATESFCCCSREKWRPYFNLRVETKSYILTKDHVHWMAKSRNLDKVPLVDDPLVQKVFEGTESMVDGARTVNRRPRYKAVRNHEKQHRIHARLNFGRLEKTLGDFKATSFDSREACEDAASKKLKEALDQFKNDQDDWAAKVEKGEYPK